jgi:hypothetical protein
MDNSTFLTAVVSLLIGSLTTFYVTYWRTRYTVKSQDLSKRIETICDLISKLEELSCKYWGGDETVSEHYILGCREKIELLLKYLDKENKQFNKSDVSAQSIDFFKACTGGSFETAGRKNNPEAQRHVLISGSKLQIALMTIRNKLY